MIKSLGHPFLNALDDLFRKMKSSPSNKSKLKNHQLSRHVSNRKGRH